MLCRNYRAILISCIGYKILSAILCGKLKPHLSHLIGNHQCVFRSVCCQSTTDQIFALRRILDKTYEFQVETHHLFNDFKAAYDYFNQEELYGES